MEEGEEAQEECVLDALQADSTPTILVDTFYGPLPVACGSIDDDVYDCSQWQVYACDARVCSREYYDFAVCAGCPTARAALEACRDANPEHEACRLELVAKCYPEE